MRIKKEKIQDRKFIDTYINKIIKEISFDENIIKKFFPSKSSYLTAKKKIKSYNFGNGGSSAIASHFSVDLTKKLWD